MKKKNTEGTGPSPSHPLSLSASFFFFIRLPLYLPLPPSSSPPCLSLFSSFFGEAEGSSSLSLPQFFSGAFLFLNIFRITNSQLSTFASFPPLTLGGGGGGVCLLFTVQAAPSSLKLIRGHLSSPSSALPANPPLSSFLTPASQRLRVLHIYLFGIFFFFRWTKKKT